MTITRRILLCCALLAAGAAGAAAQGIATGARGSGGAGAQGIVTGGGASGSAGVAGRLMQTSGGLEIDGIPVTLRASGALLQVYLGDEPYPESRMKMQGERTLLLSKTGEPAGQMVVEGRRVLLLPVAPGSAGPGRLLIGVSLTSPDEILAGHLGVEPQRASVITSITDDWPAAKAGLTVGDVIISVGDQDSGTSDALREVIAAHEAGDSITLGVISAGQKKRVSITLSDDARASATGVLQYRTAANLADQYAAAEARRGALTRALVDTQRQRTAVADQLAARSSRTRASDLYRRQLEQDYTQLKAREGELDAQSQALAQYLAATRSGTGVGGAPVTIQDSDGALRAIVSGGASAGTDVASRLAALEARIARMEDLLKKLTEQSDRR